MLSQFYATPMTFFLITKYCAKYCRQHDKNWHICCCFSLVLHSVKFYFKKLRLVLAYNIDIKSVPSPFTFVMITFFHLNRRAWSVFHTTSFSDSLFPIALKCFLSYLYFFLGGVGGGLPSNTLS